MTKQDIWVIYSTFGRREEALSAAHVLVENRLVACANLYENVTSVYRWQGAVTQGQEAVLIAKTSKEKLQAAIDQIKALHSYALPCIVAYPVADGFPPFLQWVSDETSA